MVTEWQRNQAWIRCYQLIEQAQVGPVGAEVAPLIILAAQRHWPNLECLLHFARVTQPDFGLVDPRALDDLAEAAQRSGDDTMLALALAARATHPGFWAERDLPRAVALLDACGGSAVDRPLAYLACAHAYHRRGLWELALEMLDRAQLALVGEWPPDLTGIAAYCQQILALNRTESMLPLTCALLEVEDHDQARRLASARNVFSDNLMAALPAEWVPEVQAVQCLLAAIAGEPESAEPEPAEARARLLGQLHSTQRLGYRACVLLAGAIRAHDAGQFLDAARLAEVAWAHVDADFGPALSTICLKFASSAEPAGTSWQRYARELALLRWRARLDVVAASRASLASERSMLENERLADRAYFDELTGLANRHSYRRHLNQLRTEMPDGDLAVIMVDVDHFKTVNDDFGHAVGDEVLRRLGTVLRASARTDDLAVRLGGDEFLMLCQASAGRDVTTMARDLVLTLAAHRWPELTDRLQVTVSAGLAIGAPDQVDELVRRADTHLYRAKSTGRNRLVHDDSIVAP